MRRNSQLLRRKAGLTLATLAILAMGTLGASACSDDPTTDETDTSETDTSGDLTGRSVYGIKMTLESGEVIAYESDFTGTEAQHYAFGSTHIAPAVSLAVSDNRIQPRTIVVDLNFGIIVGSNEFAIATDGPGTYAFDATPPNIAVFVQGLQYDALVAGSTGSVIVEEWGVNPGDTASGTFSGSIFFDRADGQPSDRNIMIEGWFHFTLPERENGQPG